MRFDIKREIFLDAIQKTLGIVEKKTTMPILNNVLIRTEEGGITVVATDREISLMAGYEAHVTDGGEVTVSAKKLYEMIREIQGEVIHFEANEQHSVKMTCQKIVYRIPGISADEFPRIAEIGDDVKFFPIEGSILRELIRKTSFSMSSDESRKNLHAVLLEATTAGAGKRVKMVATDGHRLAQCYADLVGEFLELEKGVIIPRKGLLEIRKLMEEEPDYVAIGVMQGMCIIRTDHSVLKVSLIDAEYPDYHKIIPAEEEVSVRFEKDLLLHALRRMNVISSERYSGVIITLSDDKMVLNSNNPDVGEADDEIEISYQGREIVAGYNVNYLLDAIEVIDEEMMLFQIGVGMKPSVIAPVGNDRYSYIVMPLRI